jgi:metal-responsive CopG/Arc/MetJ family transcriptional regulator
MKFPDMTTTTINVPTRLLEEIDTYAEKHLLNRSACIRLLATQGLKDATVNPDSNVIAKRYAGIEGPLV